MRWLLYILEMDLELFQMLHRQRSAFDNSPWLQEAKCNSLQKARNHVIEILALDYIRISSHLRYRSAYT